MLKVDITRIQEDSRYERDNSVTRLQAVTYFIGDHDGPFTKRFPAAATGVEIRQELEKHAREIETARGQ